MPNRPVPSGDKDPRKSQKAPIRAPTGYAEGSDANLLLDDSQSTVEMDHHGLDVKASILPCKALSMKSSITNLEALLALVDKCWLVLGKQAHLRAFRKERRRLAALKVQVGLVRVCKTCLPLGQHKSCIDRACRGESCAGTPTNLAGAGTQSARPQSPPPLVAGSS